MTNKITSEEIDKVKNIPMLFILGNARSGTTLLQSVLNSHPAIIGPPESKFMMVLYPRFIGIKRWTEKNIYDFIEELYRFPFFSERWQIDKALLTTYLLTAKEKLTYSLACKIVYYLKRKDKENVQYLSDKNPDYVFFIHKLLKLFPDAKFIHLVREPRDTALSTFKAFDSNNTFYIAIKWVAVNTLIERLKKKIPKRTITVMYENMVENPEVVFKSICAFLNISFIPEMLERKMPEKLSRNTVIIQALEKRQSKLFTNISPSSIGKWKTDLKAFDATIIENITGKYATQQYGYDMKGLPDKAIHVSYFKILKGKCIYYIWQVFTQMRYNSLSVNKMYSKVKQKSKGDKILPHEYF